MTNWKNFARFVWRTVMDTKLLATKGSTPRLVYEALVELGRTTQVQIAERIKRSPSAVCKSLRLLVDEGFARLASKTPNRRGSGKKQFWYEHTGLEIGDAPTGSASQAELMMVMRGFVAGRKDS